MESTDRSLQETLRDHEARIAWLEVELARVAAKADAVIQFGDARDTPTPKPETEVF